MDIPSEILNGEPGIYTFTYNGYKYGIVVGNIEPGSTVGITIHGGGGGSKDTHHIERTLLNGQTFEEAANSETCEINTQNQIDIFPIDFNGYSGSDGRKAATNLVIDIADSVKSNYDCQITYMPEGHSKTSRDAIKCAKLFVENGGKVDQTIALLIEQSQIEDIYLDTEEVEFMRDNNVTFVQIRGHSSYNPMQDDMKTIIGQGMPFIDVELNLITPDGGIEKDFYTNHRVARTLFGDLNYSDIAKGTFSWSDAFSPDKDGNYLKHYDDYSGITYEIHAYVKVYNIPGFTNGEEVPLDVLDTYLSSLVMSDEEFLTSEIANMRTIVNTAISLSSAYSNLQCSYSTSKIPSQYTRVINSIITCHKVLIYKLVDLLDEIDSAKESFALVDRELYLRAIERLNGKELEEHINKHIDSERKEMIE